MAELDINELVRYLEGEWDKQKTWKYDPTRGRDVCTIKTASKPNDVSHAIHSIIRYDLKEKRILIEYKDKEEIANCLPIKSAIIDSTWIQDINDYLWTEDTPPKLSFNSASITYGLPDDKEQIQIDYKSGDNIPPCIPANYAILTIDGISSVIIDIKTKSYNSRHDIPMLDELNYQKTSQAH